MSSGVKYTSEVLNQRGAPALFEDILTNRPAAGFKGRLFFATDVTSGSTIFRDSGTTWDALAGNGGGGGGVSTLSNGLTLTGSNGTLGGTLTNNTTIEGDGAFSLTLNSLTNFNAYSNIGVLGSVGGTSLTVERGNAIFKFDAGNVLINTSTDIASSIFTVASTTKGALLPRMSIGQRIAIATPATGLLVYDTTLLLLYQYNGTSWVAVGGTDTNIYNTSGTLTAARTLTLSTFSLTITGTTSSRFFANGNLGIGTTTDAGFKLDVNTGDSRINGLTVTNYLSMPSGTEFFGSSNTYFNGPSINAGTINFRFAQVNMPSTAVSSLTSTGAVSGTSITGTSLIINSTTNGALLPRMTTTQKNAIATPATGLTLYDTTLNKLCVYTGAAWETVTSL